MFKLAFIRFDDVVHAQKLLHQVETFQHIEICSCFGYALGSFSISSKLGRWPSQVSDGTLEVY
jgi:hypothetical protein